MRGLKLAAIVGGNASLPKRSRDQIRDVQMRFQGLRGTYSGYGTIPMFGPFINSLDAQARREWRKIERANGTHCVRALSYAYSEPDYTYPLPPADFTKDLATLRVRLLEDFDADLIPILEMAGDGQGYDPQGGTYGFPWFMQNYDRIADALGDDLLDQLIEFDCWESTSNGGWSPQNLYDASTRVRRRRPNAVLAWHFAYAWAGDGASLLGPIGEWAGPGADCDVMLGEGDAPFLYRDPWSGQWEPFGPTGAPYSNEQQRIEHVNAINGWQQRARCWLGPACNDALIYPGNKEPYYWPPDGMTPRGPRTACAWEIDEYRDTRGNVSEEELDAERVYLTSLGFRNVC